MTWRVCQEAKKCPNVYLWLWSFTTTACSYMPEIQWICLQLFCTCNVYSFAFGILSNRWSSKSPHFAWHSSTWALRQDFPHCLSCECKRSPKLIRPGRKAVFISETSLVTVALRSVCFRDVALVFRFCQLTILGDVRIQKPIRDIFIRHSLQWASCSTTLNKTHHERFHWQYYNWHNVFRVEATKHWELRAV